MELSFFGVMFLLAWLLFEWLKKNPGSAINGGIGIFKLFK